MKIKKLHVIKDVSAFLVGYTLIVASFTSYAVNDCHKVENDAERLTCYDNEIAEADNRSALENRNRNVRQSLENPFSLTPYRMNYILPVTNNSSPNEEPFEDFFEVGEGIDREEAKFQISVQFVPWDNMFDSEVDFYFTYTQQSWWQVYNTDISSPFRETNYEPEFGVMFDPDFEFFGLKSSLLRIGFNHQSNGRGELLSRSWNRLYATLSMESGNFVTVLRPWIRIEEDDDDDDNPDIEDFMGNFEWYGFYKYRDLTTGVMIRNNFDSGDDNRSAYQIDATFPLPFAKNISWYIQYFNGYGESLVDYNHRVNRIGIGFALSDWL
jgi:phospholipase A1